MVISIVKDDRGNYLVANREYNMCGYLMKNDQWSTIEVMRGFTLTDRNKDGFSPSLYNLQKCTTIREAIQRMKKRYPKANKMNGNYNGFKHTKGIYKTVNRFEIEEEFSISTM